MSNGNTEKKAKKEKAAKPEPKVLGQHKMVRTEEQTLKVQMDEKKRSVSIVNGTANKPIIDIKFSKNVFPRLDEDSLLDIAQQSMTALVSALKQEGWANA